MTILNSYPQDGDNTIYIQSWGNDTLEEILDKARAKWGDDVDLSDVTIRGEKIHTRCITYDLYDGADWDDYIIIERKI